MSRIDHAIDELLNAIGERPDRPGLRDTPQRVARFWQEFLAPEQDGLDTSFDEGPYDEMVMLRRVPFYSMCEHHLLPFFGHASVAYIPRSTVIGKHPSARVIGISKLARIVRLHAGALQVQERLTSAIAVDVKERTTSDDVGVSLEALHLCMAMRGVRLDGATMVTNALFGALRTEPEARAEFLALARS